MPRSRWHPPNLDNLVARPADRSLVPINSVTRNDDSNALCLDDTSTPVDPGGGSPPAAGTQVSENAPGNEPSSSTSQNLSSKFGPAATWQNLPVATPATPNFEGCSMNQDCADLDGRPVAQGQQANQPEADFSATVRRFAPFYTFGGGFEGDAKSRHIALSDEGHGGFTTDPDATSRTSLNVKVDGLLIDSQGHADLSSNVYFDDVDRAEVRVIDKSHAVSALDGELDAVSAGANPLVPGAPDIDSDLRLTYERKSGALELQGNVWGDTFPNAELLVTDHSGTTVTLGDFQTTSGAVSGPFRLIGDSPRIPAYVLIPFHAEIPLDASGDFAGSPLVRSR